MSQVAARPRTPPIIYVALVLMAFAGSAPFLGSYIQDLSPDGQNVIIGAFFMWTLAGLGAGGLGVVCTIFGARHAPRSGITIVAIVLAVLLTVTVVTFSALLFR